MKGYRISTDTACVMYLNNIARKHGLEDEFTLAMYGLYEQMRAAKIPNRFGLLVHIGRQAVELI